MVPAATTTAGASEDTPRVEKFCSRKKLFHLHMAALVLFAAGSGLVMFGVYQLQTAHLVEAAACMDSKSDNRSTGTGKDNSTTPDGPREDCNTW
ncbi:unnamed protein product [Dibothriocephalus latus]|uniref:Uncharacterized protein n=1 Tax=Dibothriocephalus latus TaxID=60516 RepID=A0A3P6RDX4_DIBLA|nr:unnamed protein product [Dibothriocephalus latus]